MSDRDYSPFGDPVWFTIRKAAWVTAKPWYGDYKLHELKRIAVRRGWFPHFSIANRWFHFYIGWKPILVKRWLPYGTVSEGDLKFYWWKHADLAPYELAVQLSARFGFGNRR